MDAFELIPAKTLEFTGKSGSGWLVIIVMLLAGAAIWYVTRKK